MPKNQRTVFVLRVRLIKVPDAPTPILVASVVMWMIWKATSIGYCSMLRPLGLKRVERRCKKRKKWGTCLKFSGVSFSPSPHLVTQNSTQNKIHTFLCVQNIPKNYVNLWWSSCLLSVTTHKNSKYWEDLEQWLETNTTRKGSRSGNGVSDVSTVGQTSRVFIWYIYIHTLVSDCHC